MSLASVLWRMRAQIRAEVELGRACADCACTPAQKLGAHPHISVPRYLRGAFCTSRRLGKVPVLLRRRDMRLRKQLCGRHCCARPGALGKQLRNRTLRRQGVFNDRTHALAFDGVLLKCADWLRMYGHGQLQQCRGAHSQGDACECDSRAFLDRMDCIGFGDDEVHVGCANHCSED